MRPIARIPIFQPTTIVIFVALASFRCTGRGQHASLRDQRNPLTLPIGSAMPLAGP